MKNTRSMRIQLVLGFICTTLFFALLFFLYTKIICKDITSSVQPRTRHESLDFLSQDIQDLYTRSLIEQVEMPEPGNSIFFHDTSTFENEGIRLTTRQACAVESAAKMNPRMMIYLLIVSPDTKLSDPSKQIVKQLMSYNNVRIRRITIDDYVINTPLENWNTSGVLQASQWPISHMSDILRYLTLWKFGGIYLDLDVVVTTSLDGLTNFAGAGDSSTVYSGVLGFSPTGLGRQVASACLQDLKTNFRGDVWGNNGPGVITRTLENICNTKDIKNMTESRCHGFTIFPPSEFYPIHYPYWRQYFTLDNSNETMKVLKNARAIHVWNKLSSTETVQVGSRVPYDILSSKYCPKVYNNCGNTF